MGYRVSRVVVSVAVSMAATIAGVVAGAVMFSGDASPEPSVPDTTDVIRVQIWEDGSGSVVSGSVDIGGDPWDLSGMTFCLSGQGCTDTGVRAYTGPVDGHAPCWGVYGQNVTVVCADGYHTTREG